MSLRQKLINFFALLRFPGSASYWELRYRYGGTSGQGSYGAEAAYKTRFLNELIARRAIASVVDFGCGDGNQLRELALPRYLGFDVSATAIERCRADYAADATKSFRHVGEYAGERADAAWSLDVLYHLVEDETFFAYLDRLFDAAERLVVVYATNYDDRRALRGRHVRHRAFTELATQRHPNFALVEAPPRPAELGGAAADCASFFVFERR